MNVLFVTKVNPTVLSNGSRQRTDQTIKALLALDVNLKIILLVSRELSEKNTIAKLKKRYPGCSISVVKAKTLNDLVAERKWKSALANLVRTAFETLFMRRWMISNESTCPRALTARVNSELRKVRYDVYLSNYLHVTPLSGVSFSGLKACDTHDLQTKRMDNRLARDHSHWLPRLLKSRVFRWSERRSMRNFDVLFAISRTEAIVMKSMMEGQKTQVIYAPASFSPEPALQQITFKAEIGFIGTNSDANVDGLVWFLEEIFPRIVKLYELVTFRIIGRICTSKRVIEAARVFGNRIELRGFVEDISSEYPTTKVWVAPIRYGTGMKIKVAEALSMKAAMVGTSSAFDSIGIEDGFSALIADEAQDFASKVIQLINDEQLRQRISAEAYEVYVRDHSFEAYACRLHSALTRPAPSMPSS